jgi:hypothetical protein
LDVVSGLALGLLDPGKLRFELPDLFEQLRILPLAALFERQE